MARAVISAMLLLSSACALRGPAGDRQFAPLAPAATAPAGSDHRIGPDDVLRVQVFGEPELSTDAASVTAAGRIDMPLLGEIAVEGMTAAEIAASLERRLGERYLVEPSVSVAVVRATLQRITVDGEVRKPGVFPFAGSPRLLQAVAMAEGPTDVARLKDVVVLRTSGGQRYAARFDLKAIRRGEAEDPRLMPNDTVVVGQSLGSVLYRDLIRVLPSLTSAFIVVSND
jgi:polysaccharide biosynthesis/export protein